MAGKWRVLNCIVLIGGEKQSRFVWVFYYLFTINLEETVLAHVAGIYPTPLNCSY